MCVCNASDKLVGIITDGDIRRQLLKDIVYVEPEPEITPGGVCRRIWVKELSITGD